MKIKKLLLTLVFISTFTVLLGCFNVSDVQSIEFVTQPKLVYKVGEELDVQVKVTLTNGSQATYNINDPALTVKGFDTTTPTNGGYRTLVVSYGSSSISAMYQVVDGSDDPLLQYFAGKVEEGDELYDTHKGYYKISNAQHLSNIRYALHENFVLMNDIDLTGIKWRPIGQKLEHAFSGTIDGYGHTISGLSNIGYNYSSLEAFTSAAGSTGYPFALIGFAKGNITIKNLTIYVDIDFDEGVGNAAFVGIYENQAEEASEASTIKFINCTVNGSIKAKDKVGGFIGSTYITGGRSPIQHIIFDNCINNATIDATEKGKRNNGRAGGFIGTWVEKSGQGSLIFIECENNGSITGGYYGEDADSELYYGAVIGYIANGNKLGTIDLSGVSNSIDGLSKIGHDDCIPGTEVTGD